MSSRLSLAVVSIAIVLMALNAAPASAGSDRPAASFYTPLALKAEGLRWQGLQQRYHRLAERPASSYYTPLELRVEGLRWQAMARTYERRTASPTSVRAGSPGFQWSDAGIGAAVGLAFAACAVALVAATRRVQGKNGADVDAGAKIERGAVV